VQSTVVHATTPSQREAFPVAPVRDRAAPAPADAMRPPAITLRPVPPLAVVPAPPIRTEQREQGPFLAQPRRRSLRRSHCRETRERRGSRSC
jgi:hypothetical protein